MDNNNNHNQHNHKLYIYTTVHFFMAYQLMNPVYQAHDVTGQTPP